MRERLVTLGVLLVLVVAAAACGDGPVAAPADAAGPEDWVEHEAAEGCQCADGSEFTFWSRTADPDKVVLFFQGGGACFSAETCSFTDGTYQVQASGAQVANDAPTGIFDFANEDNPLRDWSFIFVPYCTGDVHIGDNVHEYADDLTVAHVGYRNARSALDHLVAEFGDADEVLVTGSSAGGVPSPLMAGLLSDELPDAEIAALADASGAYPDNPAVNAGIGSLWGTFANVPDWEVNEGLAPEEWSIPGLFVQAGLHDPQIRMARYDNAWDEVQQQFTSLAGLSVDDLPDLLTGNEAQIEAAGVPVASYLAAGTDHTILGSDALYTLETEGVAFLDWLTRFVAGEEVEDVACTDCGSPTPTD